jgi:hypothetical protein
MDVWENILLVCIIYNFVTFSFFMGLPGFPNGVWLYLELASEALLIFDIFFRFVIRRYLLDN